ncbi:MAG: ATP-binding cassette domain-containing protein, partial [Leeuwenhoekiella sp.]
MSTINFVSVESVAKVFGEKVLFRDLSFGISENQKIGMVAKNGSGKTSLLQILAGTDMPDEGQVVNRKGIKISYLPQEPDLNPLLTVEQTIFDSDNETLKVIAAYEKALEH